jgi:hypothetical protein
MNSISKVRSSMGHRLPDQLIQPLLAYGAESLLVHISSVRGAGRLAIDEHPEPDGCPLRGRTHHEMHVPGMKAVDDPPLAWWSWMASRPMVHSPASAHWLRRNSAGAVKVRRWPDPVPPGDAKFSVRPAPR